MKFECLYSYYLCRCVRWLGDGNQGDRSSGTPLYSCCRNGCSYCLLGHIHPHLYRQKVSINCRYAEGHAVMAMLPSPAIAHLARCRRPWTHCASQSWNSLSWRRQTNSLILKTEVRDWQMTAAPHRTCGHKDCRQFYCPQRSEMEEEGRAG